MPAGAMVNFNPGGSLSSPASRGASSSAAGVWSKGSSRLVMMVEAGKLVEGRLVTTVEEGRRPVASWGWESLGDGLKEPKTMNKVNQWPTSYNYILQIIH